MSHDDFDKVPAPQVKAKKKSALIVTGANKKKGFQDDNEDEEFSEKSKSKNKFGAA